MIKGSITTGQEHSQNNPNRNSISEQRKDVRLLNDSLPKGFNAIKEAERKCRNNPQGITKRTKGRKLSL